MILALGVYPQLVLGRSRDATVSKVPSADASRWLSDERHSPRVHPVTPHIDYKGFSPLIAVVGGAMVVLMVGLLRGRAASTAASSRRSR